MGEGVWIPELQDSRTAYLPYVEGIEVPANLEEGKAFSIVVHVSAVLNPHVLDGWEYNPSGTSPWWSNVVIRDEPSVGKHFVDVGLWIMEREPSGPPVSSVSVEIPGLAAGSYVLSFDTADSREWGGLSIKFYPQIPSFVHEHATNHEISLVVSPAQ